MKVQLIDIDSRMPNLALMKLSAFHKKSGHKVTLSNFDCARINGVNYASIMFSRNRGRLKTWMIAGGPGGDPSVALPDPVENMFPDYSLYKRNNSSVGFTFKGCPRRCPFCVVKDQKHGDDYSHHSIYEFLDRRYGIISLLNNNTFFDPLWKETFKEVWKENLIIWDHNGYDLRLLDPEKLWYLEHTRWQSLLHFAWDRYIDKDIILEKMKLLRNTKLRNIICFYVLVGFETSPAEDYERVMTIRRQGFMVWVMPYRKDTEFLKRLVSWVNWRKTFYGVSFRDYVQGLRPGGYVYDKKKNVERPSGSTYKVHQRAFESF